MAIVNRLVKGSALTHTELDGNFTDLDGRVTANAAGIVAITVPNQIIVTQANAATTLGGTIDSTQEYIITEIIDMTGITITVPTGGIYLKGHNFNISQLVSTAINETLFSSIASGDILMVDLGLEASGAGSKVYDIKSATGFNAIEVVRINYNNCASLGTIDNYRQGLEEGTGRFGGTPSLILKGAWAGGFKITNSITRSLTAGTYDLFVSGALFVMQSRFFSDMNVDLPAGVGFADFVAADFPNSNTFQLEDMIITRAGVFNSNDALYVPNLSASSLACRWLNNVGLHNTHVGGKIAVTAEIVTPITVVGTAVAVTQPTWTSDHLDHFDVPSSGRLRHLGTFPSAYKAHLDIVLDSLAGDNIRLEVWVRDTSAATDSKIYEAVRVVNNLQGGRDVAYFSPQLFVTLDEDDEIYLKVANQTTTADVTFELTSALLISAR